MSCMGLSSCGATALLLSPLPLGRIHLMHMMPAGQARRTLLAKDLFTEVPRRGVAPQGTVDQPELNNKRVPAKPLLMIEVSKEGPHEPAPAILSQRALPRLRPLRRGPHSDP